MAFYNIYIGNADDPKFHWDGGNHSGNIPSILLNLGSPGLHGCAEARQLLESQKYGGKVLDWGSSGARLLKEQILQFANEFFHEDWQREQAVEKIKTLDPARIYILFACEQ
jgi:hypothetical protein